MLKLFKGYKMSIKELIPRTSNEQRIINRLLRSCQVNPNEENAAELLRKVKGYVIVNTARYGPLQLRIVRYGRMERYLGSHVPKGEATIAYGRTEPQLEDEDEIFTRQDTLLRSKDLTGKVALIIGRGTNRPKVLDLETEVSCIVSRTGNETQCEYIDINIVDQVVRTLKRDTKEGGYFYTTKTKN